MPSIFGGRFNVPGVDVLLRKGFRDTNNLIIDIFLKQKRNLKKYCGLLKSPEHGLGINMGKNLNYP